MVALAIVCVFALPAAHACAQAQAGGGAEALPPRPRARTGSVP